MKKLFILAVAGACFSMILAACGSSKGGNCDAYGSVDNVEQSDLASK